LHSLSKQRIFREIINGNIMKYRRTPPSLTINRLARYLNYLTLLPPEETHVSSAKISKALGIKATQFRQDFHYFGGFGRPGLGYDRNLLIEVLKKILGVDKIQGIVIIGVGHLGTALASYGYFEKMNLKLLGLFDSNPKMVGLSIRGIPIMHPDHLPKFVESHDVRLGIITAPKEAAQPICDQLIKAGIKGIWNFSPIQLKGPEGFIVRNEQPALGLLALTFQLNELEHHGVNRTSPRKAYSFD